MRTYTASEKVWQSPNLFTRVYTRLEVVWCSKPLRCRYNGTLGNFSVYVSTHILPLKGLLQGPVRDQIWVEIIIGQEKTVPLGTEYKIAFSSKNK